MPSPAGCEVWVHPSQTTYHSLAHEFVHLLQGKDAVPKGEKSCDVFALARHWTLNDSVPFYVRVPGEFRTPEGKIGAGDVRGFSATTARSALDMRKTGMRNYISYFEETLESLRPSLKDPGTIPPARC